MAIDKLHSTKTGRPEFNVTFEYHYRQVAFILDDISLSYIIQHILNYLSGAIKSAPINLEMLAKRLKVLAEPKRLLIFNLLMEGVQCNCELGDSLQIPPNLISHHLGKLRSAGLVNAERDAVDSRWVYYSVNRAALDELNAALGVILNPDRIQPRQPKCGPRIAKKEKGTA